MSCRYGEPSVDGVYKHWNHAVLPHWNKQEAEKYPHGVLQHTEHQGCHTLPLPATYSTWWSYEQVLIVPASAMGNLWQ